MSDGNDPGKRLRSLIVERESVGEVNLQDLECALHNGDRVVVVVRHAECPPLEKNDGHSQLEAPLKVYVTHDINVGCFLAGRGVVTRFEDHSWSHYLDAAVAFLGRNGHARYGFLRTWESRHLFDC